MSDEQQLVIDTHGHIVAPRELYAYRELLIGARGHYGRMTAPTEAAHDHLEVHHAQRDLASESGPEILREPAAGHIRQLDEVGTTIQIISGRPYSLMHSEKPTKIVHWWAETVNDAISAQTRFFPHRLAGWVNLPQTWGDPISDTFDELDRCMADPGFVGVMINPDPSEGRGTPPGLGDEYWYPLYEKLVAYGAPFQIHSCGYVGERVNQSMHFINEESNGIISLLLNDVFETFPDLKVLVPHGGGSLPYQIGRFAGLFWMMNKKKGTFLEAMQKLYFDTTLYTDEAVELLVRVMGPEHVVMGTERPGDGSKRMSPNGYPADDAKSVLEHIDWLTDEDRRRILSENALKIIPRLQAAIARTPEGAPEK